MAYVKEAKAPTPTLEYLPMRAILRDGSMVELDYVRGDGEIEQCRTLLNDAIEEGQTYPYRSPLDKDAFRAYFLSDDAFVVRAVDDVGAGAGAGADGSASAGTTVLSTFYVKPNFPGRASHICNGGFIVSPAARRRGLGRLMGACFIGMARDLGYRRSMFNLVFVSNEASVALWRKLGFRETGRVPQAGDLKGLGYVDALQIGYDFTGAGDDPMPVPDMNKGMPEASGATNPPAATDA